MRFKSRPFYSPPDPFADNSEALRLHLIDDVTWLEHVIRTARASLEADDVAEASRILDRSGVAYS